MLFQKITEDLKNAMKDQDKVKLEAIRFLFSQVKKEAIDSGNRDEISDEIVIKVASRRIKQGKDSINQFRQAGREDLAKNEEEQIIFIEKYLPKMMSHEEIKQIVMEKIEILKFTDKSKSGQLVGQIMQDLKGKADGSLVKQIVDECLAQITS